MGTAKQQRQHKAQHNQARPQVMRNRNWKCNMAQEADKTQSAKHSRICYKVAIHTRINTLQSCKATQKHHTLCLQQFHVHLTFFSKFFSHFPHGTCLLSDPSRYQALDELYHHLCDPLPKNATQGCQPSKEGWSCCKGVSPSMLLFPTRHTCPLPLAWRLYSTRQDPSPEYHYELFLVRSLLLEESFSVCCPLLTYMLKFSRRLHLMPCIFHAMCLITSPWQSRAYQLANAMAHAPNLHTIQDITDKVQ